MDFCATSWSHRHTALAFAVLLASVPAGDSVAAALDLPSQKRVSVDAGNDETVVYPRAFFDTYSPVNALDMIQQLPGFRLVNGGGSRGFGGNAGNVLIDGERPSSKQDSVSDILSRIPAQRVERVELVRGDTGSLTSGGQSVVANVVLLDSGSPSWTWGALIEQDTDRGDPEPGVNLSVVAPYGDTSLSAGLELRHLYFANTASEDLQREGRLEERRDDAEATRGNQLAGNFSAETDWGALISRFNTSLEYEQFDFFERSVRTPTNPVTAPFNVDRFNDRDKREMEVGGDLQWQASEHSNLKTILVLTREWENSLSGVTRENETGTTERQQADRDIRRAESIARLEADWTGWDEHFLEFNAELALNVLDNQLAFASDTGSGFQPIEVPGADTRVEEWRGDIQVSDSWRIQDWTLEPALGAERSQIRQTGAGGRERSFFFLKPSFNVVYAPLTDRQTRLNLRRDVAQLNFFDFVSATNFGDDEINLGNPSLRPQNTWVAEFAHERRFGEVGVTTATLFYNHIEDKQGRLPVDGRDVAGNIGNGRRWGVELESTLPMDTIGVADARLDVDMRWQRSSITDPVTGLDRAFSWEPTFRVDTEFRQDLLEAQSAWGLELYYQEAVTNYELDELDVRNDGVDLELFIETTRFLGMKVRLVAQNLLDRSFGRDRQVFDGNRLNGGELFREVRDFRRGRSVILSLSGNF